MLANWSQYPTFACFKRAALEEERIRIRASEFPPPGGRCCPLAVRRHSLSSATTRRICLMPLALSRKRRDNRTERIRDEIRVARARVRGHALTVDESVDIHDATKGIIVIILSNPLARRDTSERDIRSECLRGSARPLRTAVYVKQRAPRRGGVLLCVANGDGRRAGWWERWSACRQTRSRTRDGRISTGARSAARECTGECTRGRVSARGCEKERERERNRRHFRTGFLAAAPCRRRAPKGGARSEVDELTASRRSSEKPASCLPECPAS